MEAYEKGLEVLDGKVACDTFIYQNLLKAAKNVKERHTLLLNYHSYCAKARSLGSPRLLYMGRSEIDKRDIMASSRIKRGVRLSGYILPIEEASTSKSKSSSRREGQGVFCKTLGLGQVQAERKKISASPLHFQRTGKHSE
eukprot:TRINITY_DN2156_c0_g1_i6.p1 TRINITY_DN2156_c0_g1~~TRINITY_DN2156_c0_g1_i6.p1  ORF type:complete len:141 (+),score=4.40 TRINITY_DN2156_c0_g1_i6:717-1139(+)